MTDENDTLAEPEPDRIVVDDEETFEPDRDIVEYDTADLDEDDLYAVRIEAENIGAVALAARVEIERRNVLHHDGYRATFAQHELLDIGMMLMSAKQKRFQEGRAERSAMIEDLSSSFLTGFDDLGDGIDVVVSDEQPPTVDDLNGGE